MDIQVCCLIGSIANVLQLWHWTLLFDDYSLKKRIALNLATRKVYVTGLYASTSNGGGFILNSANLSLLNEIYSKNYGEVIIVVDKYNESMIHHLPLHKNLWLVFVELSKSTIKLISPYRVTTRSVVKYSNATFTCAEDQSINVINERLRNFFDPNSRPISGELINFSISIDPCNLPFNTLEPYEIIKCSLVDIVRMLGEKFDYRTEYINLGKEDLWFFANGTPGYLFSTLDDGTVQVTNAVLETYRASRWDYILPTFEAVSVMFVEEEMWSFSWSSYIQPLSLKVWLAVMTCFVLSAVVLTLKWFNSTNKKSYSHLDAVFDPLRIFSQQSVSFIPPQTMYRVMYGNILLTALVVYFAYSGSVTSSLAVQRPIVPFNDFQKFVDSSYKISITKNSFMQKYFQDLFREMKKDSNRIVSAEDDSLGLNLVCSGQCSYAGIRESHHKNKKYKCPIMELKIPMGKQYNGLVISKNSMLKHHLKVGVLRLKNAGIINKMEQKTRGILGNERRNEFPEVHLLQILPALAVLAIGILTASMMAFIEIAIDYSKTRLLRDSRRVI